MTRRLDGTISFRVCIKIMNAQYYKCDQLKTIFKQTNIYTKNDGWLI